MSHTAHPDVHEHGLADDCPGCAGLAENPIRELDDRMLRQLMELCLLRDRLAHCRSETEAIAAAKVLTVMEQAGHLAETHPDALAAYLTDRWRLEAAIVNPRAQVEAATMRARLEGS